MSNPWPLYSGNNEVVNAIDIASVRQLVNGYGEITPTGGFPKVSVTDSFMQLYRPVATGYLVNREGSPLFYMSKTAFEAVYTKSGSGAAWADITGKPATFAPTIGMTATTAMAGNKVPTSTDRGGVLQQTAIVAITDSSGGTSGGNTVAAVPAATAATTDATAASLASTNAAITAIKNDFATLSAKYNALLAAVKASGVTA
ncbi:hypothetical protein [Serratia ficaria]|uniref:hypothetical protein n=1 Tax=Serratia ficaria TaxID=61651 RepID=UPI00217A9CD2|nr:hypothetical protein [Serratia ficaria]CAI1023205.1 Uncharacterised protein [Serratia ficaria]CAI1990664.1 Uncharacterised protein [Serratia ficaria]